MLTEVVYYQKSLSSSRIYDKSRGYFSWFSHSLEKNLSRSLKFPNRMKLCVLSHTVCSRRRFVRFSALGRNIVLHRMLGQKLENFFTLPPLARFTRCSSAHSLLLWNAIEIQTFALRGGGSTVGITFRIHGIPQPDVRACPASRQEGENASDRASMNQMLYTENVEPKRRIRTKLAYHKNFAQ